MSALLSFAADVLVWIVIGSSAFSVLYVGARIAQARRPGYRRPEED